MELADPLGWFLVFLSKMPLNNFRGQVFAF
jgi:hypothetical protein